MSEADPSAQPHLYLVDGSSYIFRAYHRLPPLTNRHGTPAGAVYGYTTMLWKLAGDLSRADGPTHMAVILDASEHTHRNEMYDQYKAHRPPPPEDLVPQFPLIRVATRAFSIPCIEEAGLEADDIIACYVTAAKKAGWRVTIFQPDNDLMQLVDDGQVHMLDTMNHRRVVAATEQQRRRHQWRHGVNGQEAVGAAPGRTDRSRPVQVRDRDRRGGARPLDRRGDGAGLCRGRYGDRLHRLHYRPAGGGEPGDCAQPPPPHPGRAQRRRPLI